MRFLMSAAILLSVASPTSARNVVAEDSHGITVAVMQGNGAALERIGKSAGTERFAARAGYHRTRGEIPQSNTPDSFSTPAQACWSGTPIVRTRSKRS